MAIKVCDSIMGSGKTTCAINYINQHDEKFVYLTPYLLEVKRIRDDCKGKNFVSPEDYNGAGKLTNLHYLLGKGCNVSSTHALFTYYNDTTIDLIREGEYTLIMDEVFNVLKPLDIKKSDIDILFKSGCICMAEDGEHVKWLNDTYEKKASFEEVMATAKTNNLIYYKDMMMFWEFPLDIFKAFKDVYILTYLFDAQIQKYYYDMSNIEFIKIGIDLIDGKFQFGDKPYYPDSVRLLKDKVHILEHKKMNLIGEGEYSLSSSWYKRNKRVSEKPLLCKLKKNLNNYFKNIVPCNQSQLMWTTFKEYIREITGKGYAKSFVFCNIRATNDLRLKTVLAYCINVYFNPVMKNYFFDHGVSIKEDEYALSELIQWVWRSAIRDNDEISIYIPSKRMRDLLTNWLDELANTK